MLYIRFTQKRWNVVLSEVGARLVSDIRLLILKGEQMKAWGRVSYQAGIERCGDN